MLKRYISTALLAMALLPLIGETSFAGCDCYCSKPDGTVTGKFTFPDVRDPSVYPEQCRQSCLQNTSPSTNPSGSCMRPGAGPGPLQPAPPTFNLAAICQPGPPPEDALHGSVAFLDNSRNDPGNKNVSCIPLDPGQTISNVWCNMRHTSGSDSRWCTYPAASGQPSESMCSLWEDKAWPDEFPQPSYNANTGKVSVCVSAVNWSRSINRNFQIFGK